MEATGTMEECRERKEQSPYLGRPSSGVPDLKGKQEHSQQRVKGSWELLAVNTQASSKQSFRCLLLLWGCAGLGERGWNRGREEEEEEGEGVHRQGRPDEH